MISAIHISKEIIPTFITLTILCFIAMACLSCSNIVYKKLFDSQPLQTIESPGGGVDTPFNKFNTGPGGGIITSMALQSDGRILIYGYFTSYNGTACNYLVRPIK